MSSPLISVTPVGPVVSQLTADQMLKLSQSLAKSPSVAQHFKWMSGVYLAFFIIAAIFTIATIVICIKMLLDVFWKVSDEYIQVDLYWLLSTPAVVSSLCMLGIIFPRSSGILYSIGLATVVMALATTCTLLRRLYGGREAFSQYLLTRRRSIELATKPFCCCCICLPSVIPTTRNIRLLSLLVDQTPFVRISIAIALIIISLEGSPLDSPVVTTLNALGVVSTLTAVYAAQVLIRLGEEDFGPSGFDIVFKCTNTAQLLYTVQRFVLEMLGRNGVFSPMPPMQPENISSFWFNVGMISWYLIIALILAVRIRPGRSTFFAAGAGKLHSTFSTISTEAELKRIAISNDLIFSDRRQ